MSDSSLTLETDRHLKSNRVGVVIVAAGQSTRMNGEDKTFIDILGLPLIAHTIWPFELSDKVHEIVLVLPQNSLDRGRLLIAEEGYNKVSGVHKGGITRQDSVKLGLKALTSCEWVIIHDGARPCVTQDLIDTGLESVKDTGATIAGVPVTDTIKIVTESKLIKDTLPRDTLWASQTPQIFKYDILIHAHNSTNDSYTDDAAMLEQLGYQVTLFKGSYSNIKMTTPEDVPLIKTILQSRQITHH